MARAPCRGVRCGGQPRSPAHHCPLTQVLPAGQQVVRQTWRREQGKWLIRSNRTVSLLRACSAAATNQSVTVAGLQQPAVPWVGWCRCMQVLINRCARLRTQCEDKASTRDTRHQAPGTRDKSLEIPPCCWFPSLRSEAAGLCMPACCLHALHPPVWDGKRWSPAMRGSATATHQSRSPRPASPGSSGSRCPTRRFLRPRSTC